MQPTVVPAFDELPGVVSWTLEGIKWPLVKGCGLDCFACFDGCEDWTPVVTLSFVVCGVVSVRTSWFVDDRGWLWCGGIIVESKKHSFA